MAEADANFLARSRTLAKLALASAAALIFLVLLLVLVVDHATVSGAFLLLWGAFLLLSATILGVALAYVFMTRGMRAKEVATAVQKAGASPGEDVGSPTGESSVAPVHSPPPEVALRLLSGDERRLYSKIVQAGGGILQKNLVGAGLFSGPKVTRILDRLEAKGLIERERHGMTNRIRLSERWRETL